MNKEKNNQYKKFITVLIGVLVLIIGVAMILSWWSSVLVLFKGSLGIILAITGLLVLYSLSLKK